MKVLHIASFNGNLGDIIANEAFHKFFLSHINPSATFTKINLRDFYQNAQKRTFSLDFARYINTFDLLVLGGGRYFDVKRSYSATGTTWDFSEEFIRAVSIPVLFNSIGYTDDGIDRNNTEKFWSFLTNITSRKNWLVCLRNDGSKERIRQKYAAIPDSILEIPDNGFFLGEKDICPFDFGDSVPTVGISCISEEFVPTDTCGLQEYFKKLASVVAGLIDMLSCRIIFFLQTPQDLRTAAKILDCIGDHTLRNHVVIAPYMAQSMTQARHIISLYKACTLVVAMRLHSNIIALQNNIPAIGLDVENTPSQNRIAELYRSSGLSDYCCQLSLADDFASKILGLLPQVMSDEYTRRVAKSLQQLSADNCRYMEKIAMFVTSSHGYKPTQATADYGPK